jgi:uncharacterized protein (DUF1684 family)
MVRATAALGVLVMACGVAIAQTPNSTLTPADRTAAIVAAQKKIDHEYGRALMSPFTAVAVQYFQPGQTVRLGVSDTGVGFDPAVPMTDVIEMTLEADTFSVSPVSGSKPPVVLGKNAEGDVVVSPGTPLRTRTKISRSDVVGLGRYFVESFATTAPGNVRVFDPESPAKRAFTGLKWFAPDLALQVKATYVPIQNPDMVVIATSRGLKKDYFRVGMFHFVLDGKPQTLTALAVSATPKAGDELFVPFRDATTGVETYEVGRFLFIPFAGPDSPYVLDFNAATNPLCNYSPHYNCPIPPKENRLAVPIRAGEKTYPKAH